MSTTSPFVIPSTAGSAALDDLSRVPWDSLKHAYGRGVFEARIRDIGTGLPRVLHLSVDGCLRDLVSEDATVRDDAVKHGLFGTVLHQGTLYEASAHALPFLAAIAADPGVAARAMILTGVADIVRFALLRPRHEAESSALAAATASRAWIALAREGSSPAVMKLVALVVRMVDARPEIDDALDAEFEEALYDVGEEAYPSHNKA